MNSPSFVQISGVAVFITLIPLKKELILFSSEIKGINITVDWVHIFTTQLWVT